MRIRGASLSTLALGLVAACNVGTEGPPGGGGGGIAETVGGGGSSGIAGNAGGSAGSSGVVGQGGLVNQDAGTGGTGGAGGGAAGTTGPESGTVGLVPVGHCGARGGRYFPETSWIYTEVTNAPTRANSVATTAWLEAHGGWGNSNTFQIDVSFVINDADSSTQRIARTTNDPIEYTEDCDPEVSVPLPVGGRIEGMSDYICPGRVAGEPDGDCHLIVADFSSNTLFESYWATYTGNAFYTTCTIAWNMTRDVWGAAPGATLPAVSSRNWGIGRDCTGPDAAGFPIAPLLFTVGDVQSGKVEHAIRFVLPNDRIQRAPVAASGDEADPVYVWPATHAGGPQAYDANAPIYGSRWRLKPDFDPTARGLDGNNAVVRAVVHGLKHYGMLLSDGGNIALMAEDSTGCATSWEDLWGESGSRVLNGIRPSDFEVLDTGGTDEGYDCQRNAR